jgi:putative DNA primase/helicase
MHEERLREIARDATSIESAIDIACAELGEDCAPVNFLAAAWHEFHRPQQHVAPASEHFTTFAAPRMVEPFVQRIQSEATMYASYTHADAAEIFARWHAANIRRCRQTGQWYCWDGQRWALNNGDLVFDALEHFCGVYGQAALLEMQGSKGLSRQQQINSSSFISGTYALLQFKQELAINIDQLDPDDWLLNTPMGIYDLRTSALLEHDPEAMCTHMSLVSPMDDETFKARWPDSRFRRFLNEVFACVPAEERAELVGFEQASLGYCLTGDTSLHFLKFWYGEGRNGKSTLGEAIEVICGDYVKKINNQLLMASRFDRHPTEVANLFGARLVIASEISEGSYIHESMVKELTGDSRLSARFMRKDFFDFRRTHKHLIYGNAKPRIRVVDTAIKSRIKLTEFGVNFEAEGRVDPELKTKLLGEAPLILTWLTRGATALYANRLRMPVSRVVERQTEDYMAENDAVRLWLEERCETVATAVTRVMTLYEDYRMWRTARGENAESIQRWSLSMHKHGFKTLIRHGVRFYEGAGLRADRSDF